MPPRRRRVKVLPRVLEPHEADAIKAQCNLRALTGLRDRVMMEVMHQTGVRVSELCALRPADIRWEAAEIVVRSGKGGQDRVVGIGDALMPWLRLWEARRPRARTFFCTVKAGGKRPVSRRAVLGMIHRRARKAGILGPGDVGRKDRTICCHTFRHTLGAELIGEGNDVRVVQEVLGHADIGTTQIYTQINPRQAKDALRNRPGRPPGPAPAAANGK